VIRPFWTETAKTLPVRLRSEKRSVVASAAVIVIGAVRELLAVDARDALLRLLDRLTAEILHPAGADKQRKVTRCGAVGEVATTLRG
jgi:hypothetical protein